jgi:hypothetical protein
MVSQHRKGQRRMEKDAFRQINGEPRANEARNRSRNCRFAAGSKATRKRGRDRFSTGRKQKH